jgi:pilus assembly protein CpaB
VKQRFLVVVLFALAVSAAASVVLYRLISSQLASNQPAPTAKVVVATRNLNGGELIKDADVKLADYVGTPPAGVILKPEDAVNRGVVSEIYAGEVVVDSRLAAKGAGAGLAATIPQGMRAVAVRINDVVGISGFATPGQHVDILIAGNPPGNSNAAVGTLTKTLLQNIEILSAGQNIQKDAEGKPVSVAVVNLLVTPEQAEILSLASNEARIQLVLRNPTDREEAKPPGTAMAYLFKGGAPPPPEKGGTGKAVAAKRAPPPPPPPPAVAPPKPPPPPPPIVVEVFHGSRKTEAKFQAEDGSEGKSK